MTDLVSVAALKRLVTKWVERLNGLPTAGVLVTDPEGGVFSFLVGAPVSRLAVADTPAEATALQATETAYLETHTGLYWEKQGTQWVSHHYLGDRPELRPQSLCYAPNKATFYYLDQTLQLHRVNLGAELTPP